MIVADGTIGRQYLELIFQDGRDDRGPMPLLVCHVWCATLQNTGEMNGRRGPLRFRARSRYGAFRSDQTAGMDAKRLCFQGYNAFW